MTDALRRKVTTKTAKNTLAPESPTIDIPNRVSPRSVKTAMPVTIAAIAMAKIRTISSFVKIEDAVDGRPDFFFAAFDFFDFSATTSSSASS